MPTQFFVHIRKWIRQDVATAEVNTLLNIYLQ